MKKISKCIVNHLFWMFSKYYLHNNNNYDINDFFINNTIIDEEFDYKLPINKLSFNNTGIINYQNKLILKSEETKKRLKFVLKHQFTRNKENLINFYKNKYMTDYYSEIHDFNKYNSQIILKGKKVIKDLFEDLFEDILILPVNDKIKIDYIIRELFTDYI